MADSNTLRQVIYNKTSDINKVVDAKYVHGTWIMFSTQGLYRSVGWEYKNKKKMFTGYYENKANRGREIRRVYTFKKDLCEEYSDTRTETLNQKTTDKPIGRIDSGMKKLSLLL